MTLSLTEAEYVAVSEACTDIMFIKMIMEFLELEVERPIKVYCDNVDIITKNFSKETHKRHSEKFMMDVESI